MFTYDATPGTLTLQVTSTSGTVTLDPAATAVKDGAGNGPPGYSCTDKQLQFTLVTKMTYTASIRFRFLDPGTDTGEIKESCPNPDLDDNVDASFRPNYTIKVA